MTTLQPVQHNLSKCSCSKCTSKREQHGSILLARRYWDKEARASHEAIEVFLKDKIWMVTFRSKYYKTSRTFVNSEPIEWWNQKVEKHDSWY